MTEHSLSTIEVVAFGVIALFAAALILAPESAVPDRTRGIGWLIVSLLALGDSIRRKDVSSAGPEVRPGFLLALSLVLFFVVFLQIVFMETWGLAQILTVLGCLVAAVFSFVRALVQERRADSMQDEWRDISDNG